MDESTKMELKKKPKRSKPILGQKQVDSSGLNWQSIKKSEGRRENWRRLLNKRVSSSNFMY